MEFVTSERNPLLVGIFHTSQKAVPLCNENNVPWFTFKGRKMALWLYTFRWFGIPLNLLKTERSYSFWTKKVFLTYLFPLSTKKPHLYKALIKFPKTLLENIHFPPVKQRLKGKYIMDLHGNTGNWWQQTWNRSKLGQ